MKIVSDIALQHYPHRYPPPPAQPPANAISPGPPTVHLVIHLRASHKTPPVKPMPFHSPSPSPHTNKGKTATQTQNRRERENANPHSRYFPAAKVSSRGMHMQRTNSMIIPNKPKAKPLSLKRKIGRYVKRSEARNTVMVKRRQSNLPIGKS